MLFPFLTMLYGQECDSGFVWLEDIPIGCGGEHNCFYEADLNVLQIMINNSSETINMSLDDNEDGIMEPVELGYTEWVDGRLVALDCFLSDIMPCNLSGPLPQNIGDLEYLEALWLSGNQLSGEIPFEIGRLNKLNSLRLFDNQLTGEIPSSVGHLIQLEFLYLQDNQLTGDVPSEIKSLIHLKRLNLEGNQLTVDIQED